MVLCTLPAPVSGHWPGTGCCGPLLAHRQACRACQLGQALGVWRLDSATARDSGAHFAMCFMLVVSHALG